MIGEYEHRRRPPDPADPLAACPCGYKIYNDQTFIQGGVFVGRVVTYRCAGVVVIQGDGIVRRATPCWTPHNNETAVTAVSDREDS